MIVPPPWLEITAPQFAAGMVAAGAVKLTTGAAHWVRSRPTEL
jgi:hypothetical protein